MNMDTKDHAMNTANNPVIQSGPEPAGLSKRLIILLVLAAAGVLAIAWGGFKVMEITQTGTLVVSADNNGQLTLVSPNEKDKSLGKGSATVRLKPGNYQVVAANNDNKAAQNVTIRKQQKTTVQLHIRKTVPVQKLAKYSGYNVFAQDEHLYFVEATQRVLYDFSIQSGLGRPYLTNINDVAAVHWVSARQFFYRDPILNWAYVDNSVIRPVEFANLPSDPASFSVNASGAHAFVSTNKDVVTAANPVANPQRIDTANASNTQTAISPTGSVLVYTPAFGDHDFLRPTKLYANSALQTLGGSLEGINNIQWSTDGSRFSYTKSDGMYTYTLATKAVQPVLVKAPSSPRSVLWTDATHFIYAEGSEIWQYDAAQQTAYKLVKFTGKLESPSTIFSLSADKKYVYFSTLPNDFKQDGGIFRLAPNYDQLTSSEQQSLTSQPKTTATLVYNNFEQLSDAGVATDQVSLVKYALTQFVGTLNTQVMSVSLAGVNIDSRDRESTSPLNTASFTIQLDNGTQYTGRLEYSLLSSIRLYVSNSAGKQVYDSGPLDSQQ
jgi:hypothetical protein